MKMRLCFAILISSLWFTRGHSEETEKRWNLPVMNRGDCTLLRASLIIRRDGSGSFSAETKTSRTTSGDIWHQYLKILDDTGNVLVSLGPADSPRMYPGQGPNLSKTYEWSTAFNYDITFPSFERAAKLDHSRCSC